MIDLKNKKLLFNTYVAHGRNTGDEFAKSFSNKEGSLKSSLGFYVTKQPITGSHTGFSLMIEGVEKGFNDNACRINQLLKPLKAERVCLSIIQTTPTFVTHLYLTKP